MSSIFSFLLMFDCLKKCTAQHLATIYSKKSSCCYFVMLLPQDIRLLRRWGAVGWKPNTNTELRNQKTEFVGFYNSLAWISCCFSNTKKTEPITSEKIHCLALLQHQVPYFGSFPTDDLTLNRYAKQQLTSMPRSKIHKSLYIVKT